MRLWIINHYAYTPSDTAGTRHYSIAKRLIARDHEVLVVASSYYHKAGRERLASDEAFRKESVDGVPFLWIRSTPYRGNTIGRFWNMVVFSVRVWRRKGLRGEDAPDVIIGSTPDLFAALAARRLARRFRVPFVLEVHDLWPDTFVELGSYSSRHPIVWLFERIERYLYKTADRIISALPAAADRMVEKGADRRKIEWIPNGVDLDMVPNPSPPTPGDDFVVMYAGAHNPANALDSLIEAAAILEDRGWCDRIMIQLIGDGAEKPKLQNRAKNKGLKIIQFLDSVPKTEIYGLMADADVLISTWRDSPLYQWGISPNKISDYLATGRPVILSVTTPVNAIEEADAGLVIPPENPTAMANAIIAIASLSNEERWAMGRRGREYVSKMYSYDVLAERTEHHLQGLLRKAARGDTE